MQMLSDVDLDFLESLTQILAGPQLHAGVHSRQTPIVLHIHLCFVCSSCSCMLSVHFFFGDLSTSLMLLGVYFVLLCYRIYSALGLRDHVPYKPFLMIKITNSSKISMHCEISIFLPEYIKEVSQQALKLRRWVSSSPHFLLGCLFSQTTQREIYLCGTSTWLLTEQP